MRILFDASALAQLARFLQRHSVTHATRLGWHELSNGKLLAAAEQAEFDVLVTCDKNMQFQQSLRDRKLAIAILPTNHWRTLRPHVVRIATAIDFVQRGQILTIDLDQL